MLRGVLGHALLAKFCHCSDQNNHQTGCLYVHLFEGYRRDRQDGLPAVVFTVLDCSQTIEAGAAFRFRLTFISLSSAVRAAIIDALAEGLKSGLGRQRIPCRLQAVHPVSIIADQIDQHVTVNLVSPWLVKHQGRALRARTIKVHDVFVALAQRQRQVNRHFDLGLPVPANNHLLALADELVVREELTDERWDRLSNRQAKRHVLQGVTGKLHLYHPLPGGLASVSALFANGVLLHGGGKTSFGLGAFQFDGRVDAHAYATPRMIIQPYTPSLALTETGSVVVNTRPRNRTDRTL